MHLTLAFIGELPDETAVLDALEEVRFSAFEMKLRGIGSFGDLWWVGIEDDTVLRELAKKLRHALADAGIPFDRKRFSAHITLLRRPVYTRGNDLGGTYVPATGMRVEKFSLMRSDRSKDGMIYTEVGAFYAEDAEIRD